MASHNRLTIQDGAHADIALVYVPELKRTPPACSDADLIEVVKGTACSVHYVSGQQHHAYLLAGLVVVTLQHLALHRLTMARRCQCHCRVR